VGTLLLVDDDDLVRMSLGRSLSRWWHVVAVDSGAAALTAIERQSFDAVVCDLQMSGLSGIEVADTVAIRAPGLLARTVFLTGGAIAPAAEAFLARPGITHLVKPVDLDQLHQHLLLAGTAAPAAQGVCATRVL
jgi:CheY-like chemotaxis protein